ncbi:MAG: hypothetical protein IJV05_02300 [Muribaculaceae bacterium]|nr:hypothetical protein [Muribaculaceae bacterium]
MELDELKASWSTLDNRLSDSEVVSLRAVREMITRKTRSAFDGVCRHNYFNLVVCIVLIIGIFPYVYMNTPIRMFSFVVVEAAMVIGLIPQIMKLSLLLRFNLEGKCCNELMGLVLRYKKICHQEVIWGIGEVAFAMIVFYISELAFNDQVNYQLGMKMLLPLGLSVLTFGLGYILALWVRRHHTHQLLEIEQGLEELKEFENQ